MDTLRQWAEPAMRAAAEAGNPELFAVGGSRRWARRGTAIA